MPTTSDLKRGVRLELDGEPFVVVSLSTQSPSARGAATLIKTKLRNLKTKQLLAKTFKSGDRITAPDFEIRPSQFLYEEGGETYYFMDDETFDQQGVAREDIAFELNFVLPNDKVRCVFFEGNIIGLELPNTVVLEVTETEPAVKGDTVNAVTKAATVETGLEVQVPMFVEEGAKLVIDTRDGRYIRRA